MTKIVKKINQIFILLKMLAERRELYAQDKIVQEELGIDERTLRRYLDDIYLNFSDILILEKKRKDLTSRKTTIYRIVDRKKDVSSILQFFLNNDIDFSWVIELIHTQDPSLISDSKDDIKQAVENILNDNKDIFLFKSSPFEFFQDKQQRKLFAIAKRAVRNHEYANIVYFYNVEEILSAVKCLKMVYMHNNWYLAVEDNKNKFRFLRMAFIYKINYANKSTYQPSKVSRYNQFFKEFQNAFSLPNEKRKIVYLRASNEIAKYFKKDMKLFFNSQKFIKENSDKSIDFSIRYSQPIEVMPFIKRWLPDITIVKPKSLQDALRVDLEHAIQNIKDIGDKK